MSISMPVSGSASGSGDPVALCQRHLSDRIAHVRTPLPALENQTQFWLCGDFLGQAQRLAARLPDAAHAINLCENRYLFMLAFCAAILRGQTTLLPQNRAVGTQQQLLKRYSDTIILHDGPAALAPLATTINVNQHSLLGDPARSIPTIEPAFIAALAFTSGSTGQPTPNIKYWRTLVDSSRINARYMVPESADTVYQLATVPAQHMWGLETSVLLPLFAPVCSTDIKPLFPLDICNALDRMPQPRMLVSTPVHLRSMLASGLQWPPLQRTLCATAPLSSDLAEASVTQFGGDLLEVYGCSEVGSMACRRRPHEEAWHLFEGLTIAPEHDGVCHIHAAHLPAVVALQDRLQVEKDRRFHLLGRSDDMLEIAGKRGSLQELNHLLMMAPGVLDGVVFMPDAIDAPLITKADRSNPLTPDRPARSHGSNASPTRRPAALVVIDPALTSRKALVARFAASVDTAFVPRPIYFVEQLPRESSGKLPRARLLECWKAARDRNNRPQTGH